MIALEAVLKDNDTVRSIDRFESKVRQKLLFSGTAETARHVYEEVRLNASGARAPEGKPDSRTKALYNAIYRAYIPERSSDAVKVYFVTWRHADAPHGHLVEFGTSRSPAHPFVRPAVAAIPRALKAGIRKMQDRAR